MADVRSDTSGNVWGLAAFDGPHVLVRGSNGERLLTREHWAGMHPVPEDRHRLFDTAANALGETQPQQEDSEE